MNITHDREADALYIRFNQKKVTQTKPVLGYTIMVDLDENGDPIGIEILGVSQHVLDPQHINLEDITRHLIETESP